MRNSPLFILIAFVFAIVACTDKGQDYPSEIVLKGTWILEQDGTTMLDPQPSGLSFLGERLFSVSDASAHATQIKRLHELDPLSGNILQKHGPIKMSKALTSSCFVDYLSSSPDYEGLVAINNNSASMSPEWLLVTEDATRYPGLSKACKTQYGGINNTGNTKHPTLLVKISLINEVLLVTGIRALRFDQSDGLGDYPNDGIEGLALTRDGRLLIGLEKDAQSAPRVFEFAYTPSLFDAVDEFIDVKDAQLLIPDLNEGLAEKANHPINGMEVYYPSPNHSGFLIAAARNDNQLWIIDLGRTKATKIVSLQYEVTSQQSEECESTHKMNNASIEGVAVKGNMLYLINDPWRKNYNKNIVCEADRERYEKMSPLLFTLKMPSTWFE
ncbi:hypothetical protein [Glaciecola petra]|uniref:Phytase-like domain-containing protein n=1 Tax=Glaciecola petra TaxID=3075602 RepID=A0ABU2ZV71_9ALTE|nr:hypothetical protein [Aestuariibacter sp. P117]MDT0596538.1 hypothetical protein [Aestuariibacter sp. P117]